MTVGQWMWDTQGHRWLFDSGALALDFGYTGDFGYGRPEWERLHDPSDLEAWLVGRFGSLRPVTSRDLGAALRLRSAISALAVAAADRERAGVGDIDEVNRAVQLPPVRPHLNGGSTAISSVSATAALSTIAEDAIGILGTGDHRLRRCAAPDCELIFFDHSRPNARRWCSMARCGNRAKLRARRAPAATRHDR